MRTGIAILLQVFFATLMAWADETLPLLKAGPDVYSNVSITAITPTDIYFTHARGMANVKLKNLDPAFQKHFKYDAAKAEAVEKKQKEAMAQSLRPVANDRTNAQ